MNLRKPNIPASIRNLGVLAIALTAHQIVFAQASDIIAPVQINQVETQILTQIIQTETQNSTQTQTQSTSQQPQNPEESISTEPPFKDISVGDEHFVSIQYLKTNGIINGFDDGTFKSLNNVNRAEALKMIFKAMPRVKLSKTTPELTFPDVKTGEWFYEYVLNGFINGIVSGYPDKMFHPEQTINRAESLKITLLQENQPLPVTLEENPFPDVDKNEWFAPYAQIAKERTLMTKTRSNGGELLPANLMNRGDFAELIYRMIQSNNGYTFGRATFYADSLAGYGTASGDPYNPVIYTTAHKTLPFGTRLRVTNMANGKSVDVKVNDRGPYATGVELDLSKSAFASIASVGTGIIHVQYKIVQE